MSTKQRQDAEALRAKYARTFQIPMADVSVRYLENEDAEVWFGDLPRWTLGSQEIVAPPWAINHMVKTC